MNLDLQASLWAKAELPWDSFADNFKFPAPHTFPLPLPTGNLAVDVSIEVEAATSSAPDRFKVRFEADFEPAGDVSFLGFTLGRACHFTFELDCEADADLEQSQLEFAGTISVEIPVQLPAFPDFEWLHLRAGDEDGWMTLKVSATAQIGTTTGFQLRAEIRDVFTGDLQLPGLTQPTPPLHFELTTLAGEIDFESGTLSGSLAAAGAFRFEPSLAGVDVPMARYLEPLLRDIALAGTVESTFALSQDPATHYEALSLPTVDPSGPDLIVRASLLFAGNNSEFGLSCGFKNANHSIYLFDLLKRLSLNPEPVLTDQIEHVGIEFALSGICISLGKKPSFAIQVSAQAGFELDAYLMLSTEEIRIGLGKVIPGKAAPVVTVPLHLPQLSREQFGFIPTQPITDDTRYHAGAQPVDRLIYERLSDQEKKRNYNDGLEVYFTIVEQITGAAHSSGQVIVAEETPQGWKVYPPPGVTFDDDVPIRVLTGFVGKKEADGSLSTTGELAVVCRVKGDDAWHLVLARPALSLDGFYFSLPFQNPRNIRVAGTARFTVDGPLKDLDKLAVTVGLSADLIYFSLEVDGKQKIEIPEFIPGYGGGSITFAKALVGFGYTKRSLSVAFDGELVLPEKLVDDLDTSDLVGCGIRLSVQSKLAFQLDVIPIVIQGVVIPMPLFQFACDLRKDSSPGITDPSTCTPNWDGLQVIVKDVIHCSLKQISYSPMLFAYSSTNSNFGGDLVLGDEQNGFSIVADSIFWAYGVDCTAAIMCYGICGLPFFDNFCSSVRVAGFRVNFNLQRPIPSFSPLAIFEILALLCDPSYEIAPRGELADIVRISLTDAYVSLPDAVKRLFPMAGAVVHKPLNVTINIATFLTLTQRTVKTLKPVVAAVVEAVRHPAAAVAELEAIAESLRPGDIRDLAGEVLSALPPELRKLRFEADFAGFAASVVLVLSDRKSLRTALAKRGAQNDAADDRTGWQYRPNIPPVPGAPRMHDGEDPQANLLLGSEFTDFVDADLDAVPAPLSGGLLVSADVVPVLATKLKRDTDPITRYLKTRFAPRTLKLLDRYPGSSPSDSLRQALVTDLNRILKGTGPGDACIFEPGRFASLTLEPYVQALVQRHQQQPLAGQELLRLNRLLLETAYPDEMPETAGVLVGARVRVIGGQRFRFIGYVFADGAFTMITTADLPSLRLAVAGISVELPLQIDGRLSLAGRARRDGISGSIRAEGSADWQIIKDVVRLTLGDKTQKVVLDLHSDGRFALSGTALLSLFNGAAEVHGAVDISETHCFVTGEFAYRIPNVIDLDLALRGRVGPQEHFELSGAGSLSLLGMNFANVQGRIDESGAEVAFRLQTQQWAPVNSSFSLPCQLDMTLRGRIDLRQRTIASFDLRGDAVFKLDDHGLEIQGTGGISSQQGKVSVFVAGKLIWQGREWLNGRIEISEVDGIEISGAAMISFDLTPTNVPGLETAGLLLKIDIAGLMQLNPAGGLAAFDLRGAFALGLRPPGPGQQVFPLLMHSFHKAVAMNAAVPNASLRIRLAQVRDFILLGAAFSLPTPQVEVVEKGSPARLTYKTASIKDLLGNKHEFMYPSKEQDANELQVPSGYGVTLKWKDAQGNDVPAPAIKLPTTPNFDLDLVWNITTRDFALEVTPV
jgi:hypothetical protein